MASKSGLLLVTLPRKPPESRSEAAKEGFWRGQSLLGGRFWAVVRWAGVPTRFGWLGAPTMSGTPPPAPPSGEFPGPMVLG